MVVHISRKKVIDMTVSYTCAKGVKTGLDIR